MLKILSISFMILLTIENSAQETNSCAVENCHESILQFANIHSPVKNDCRTCHENNDKIHPDGAGNEFAKVDLDACEMCHEEEVTKAVVHFPFEEGQCTSCHSPHGSNIQKLLLGESQRVTCEACHDLEVAGNNFKHGPFMSGQCIGCHVGHQSDNKSLVIEKEPKLCFECHQEKAEDLELVNVHPVFEEGCLDCHSPHSSPAANMLVSGGNDLCYNCHDSVKQNVASAKMVHDPLREEGQCVLCHSPHSGELTNLLLQKQPEICFTCHSENTKNKEKYIDIYGCLQKKYLHEPLKDGTCDECHLHHVSEYNHLLSADFPSGNYTKPKIESFAMCFQCHDSKKITERITTTSTGFRDGSTNLHYVHVMKKKSISCQSCHDMHGADNEHIIGNVVYFGKWEMPIGFNSSDVGGTCLPGCHIQYSYDREKD